MDLELLWYPELYLQKKHNTLPCSVAGICMYIIISQSKNPPTFVPPNKNNNKRLFGRGFLGHFFGQPASANAHCDGGEAWVGHLQPTPPPPPRVVVVVVVQPGVPGFCQRAQGADLLSAECPFSFCRAEQKY